MMQGPQRLSHIYLGGEYLELQVLARSVHLSHVFLCRESASNTPSRIRARSSVFTTYTEAVGEMMSKVSIDTSAYQYRRELVGREAVDAQLVIKGRSISSR